MSWSQLSRVRTTLENAIAVSLDEVSWITKVEISEFNTQGEIHTISGTFTVTPWLANTPRRKGKFESKMDKDLNILSLKIQEAPRQ